MTSESDSVISKLNHKRNESMQRIKDVTNQIRSTKTMHNSTFKFNSRNCLINHADKSKNSKSRPHKRYVKNRQISLLKTDLATSRLSNSQISWSSKHDRGRNADHRPKQPRQNSLKDQSKLRHLPDNGDLYKTYTKTTDCEATMTVDSQSLKVNHSIFHIS